VQTILYVQSRFAFGVNSAPSPWLSRSLLARGTEPSLELDLEGNKESREADRHLRKPQHGQHDRGLDVVPCEVEQVSAQPPRWFWLVVYLVL